MSDAQLTAADKSAYAALDQLRSWKRLSEEGRHALAHAKSLAEGWRLLWHARHESDAMWAFAVSMPKRRVVWWATLAAWHSVGGRPNPEEDQAFLAVMSWLRNPNDGKAQAARQCAEVVAPDHPVGSVARAAGTPDAVEAAEAAATSVFLSQARLSKTTQISNEPFLAIARSIAEGRLEWE